MSPAAKNGLMLAVLVLALVGAAFFFKRSGTERTYPDDPTLATQWICVKCEKHFSLTPATYKAWLDSKDKVRRDPNFSGRIVVFWCDDCREFQVVRAGVERTTGKWYPTSDAAGNPIPVKADAGKTEGQ